MAKLINGNGNAAIYANQDADLIASLAGNVTAIAAVGNEFEATQEDANTIGLADGVIVTKEGRRIQLDDGSTDLFTIPTGTAGTTSYYIIGYKLSTQADSSQTCETFVQKMNSSSETITEDTFKGGASDVYVSCYRVTQDGLNIDTIEALLPKLSNVTALKSALTDKVEKWSGTASGNTYVTVDKLAYDSTNKKLGLKVNGADTVIPFSSQSSATLLWTNSATSSDFGTQEVSLSKSGYTHLIVEYQLAKNNTTRYGKAIVANSSEEYIGCAICNQTPENAYGYTRTGKVTSSGIQFYGGGASGNNGFNNAWCIPTKIWGINITI